MSKRIAVIGGGAAGMMAAARIAELDATAQIVLYEKNAALGRKVVISGGGRCNVTTGIQDVREVLTKYVRGSKFLTNALWNFPPAAVYAWFEEHGVPLKTENDLRVFPQSNDGHDIVQVFIDLFRTGAVDVRVHTAVHSITEEDGFHVTTDSDTSVYDAVILTTGGQAYRHTGSTGDGYAFAEGLGHSITSLGASLNAFRIQEKWMHALPGVSFEHIGFRVCTEEDTYEAEGAAVITHTGISGPAVFALSAQVAFETYTKRNPLPLELNWMPETNGEELRHIIDTACADSPKKSVLSLMQEWMPKSLATELLKVISVDLHTTLATCNKKIRNQLIEICTATQVHIVGRSAGSEFVTAGGVNTDEVDPRTMESRITPGLFFAGELLNVDGVTGGFNLQASWAAGRMAGEHVV